LFLGSVTFTVGQTLAYYAICTLQICDVL
jgi:hypothetical protein